MLVTGFGGLTAAIECNRQGHDVEIYEAFPELKILGDIISFGPNVRVSFLFFPRLAGSIYLPLLGR